MATQTNTIAGACVDAGGSALGMPQLCAEWMPNQIFWLIVTLIAIFFVMSRIALPRIGAVLAERSGTITNDIAAAEDFKNKAAEAETAYEQALTDARAKAQEIIAKAKAEIQADLDVALQRPMPPSPPRPPKAKQPSAKSATAPSRTSPRSPPTPPRNWCWRWVALLTPRQSPPRSTRG